MVIVIFLAVTAVMIALLGWAITIAQKSKLLEKGDDSTTEWLSCRGSERPQEANA